MRLTELIERLSELAERRGGDARVVITEFDNSDELEIEGVKVDTNTGQTVIKIIAS